MDAGVGTMKHMLSKTPDKVCRRAMFQLAFILSLQ